MSAPRAKHEIAPKLLYKKNTKKYIIVYVPLLTNKILYTYTYVWKKVGGHQYADYDEYLSEQDGTAGIIQPFSTQVPFLKLEL